MNVYYKQFYYKTLVKSIDFSDFPNPKIEIECPEEKITREESVKLLTQFFEFPKNESSENFLMSMLMLERGEAIYLQYSNEKIISLIKK